MPLYLITFSFFYYFYVVITCKYSCSYHIFVAVSQIYLAIYGTISFTPCPYMTLTNKSLLSIWPNYFVAEWKTESFCSLQMEGGWRKGSYSFLPHDQEPDNTKEQTETSQSFRREQVPFPVTGQDDVETRVN